MREPHTPVPLARGHSDLTSSRVILLRKIFDSAQFLVILCNSGGGVRPRAAAATSSVRLSRSGSEKAFSLEGDRHAATTDTGHGFGGCGVLCDWRIWRLAGQDV